MDKIKVIITNKQKDVKIPTGLRMLVRRCCNAVLQMEQFEGSVEVSVTFVNNKQIRELNGIYRNIDRVTDVLSFPMGEDGKYDTDFIDVMLWESIAQNTAEYCKKGDIVGIKGRIQTSIYEEEDGRKRKTTEVVAEKVTFLSSKKDNE